MVNVTFNGKCNMQNIFSLPYKEIHWQKFQLCSPSPLHVYSGAIEKRPFNYNYSFCIITAFALKDKCLYVNLLAMCIIVITNK